MAEIFLLRGIELTHETVRDWEERFAPLFTTILKAKRKGKPGKKIHVDETYLKVKGQEVYLYRAIDKHGNLVDVMLSKKRDLEAAEAFFKKMRRTLSHKPEKITTDGHASYPKAIRKVFRRKVEHRTSKFLNNYIERATRNQLLTISEKLKEVRPTTVRFRFAPTNLMARSVASGRAA